jgi:hypothetical protein
VRGEQLHGLGKACPQVVQQLWKREREIAGSQKNHALHEHIIQD